MADVLRNKRNTWFQKRNHIALKKSEVTKKHILSAGVSRAAALGFEISDLADGYSYNGEPAVLVIDNGAEYYRLDGVDSTYAAIVDVARASVATYVDASGVRQTALSGVARDAHYIYNGLAWVRGGLLIEPTGATNLLLNTATLSTQNVTVGAGVHTLHFTGAGTVTLTGVATGTLVGVGATEVDREKLTFTATAGTLTVTVSGSVTAAQLETGAIDTSYVPSSGTAGVRLAEVCTVDPAKMPYNTDAVSIVLRAYVSYRDNDDAEEAILLRLQADADNFIKYALSTAGANEGAVVVTHRSNAVSAVVSSTSPGPLSPDNEVPIAIASSHVARA